MDASLTEAKPAIIPNELLDEWASEDETIPATFLFHPSARKLGTEKDVRNLLEKKQITLVSAVSCDEFVKLASVIQRKGAKSGEVIEMPTHLQRYYNAIDKIVARPSWSSHDDAPARLSDRILVGSAAHARDVSQLQKLGVTAVLDCAPSVSEDPVDAYKDSGIAYHKIESEDFEGYPLLELHLEDAHSFVAAQGPKSVVLVHCFAGINRSATLALALHMAAQRQPLLPAVEHAFSIRPFILSNASFRRGLVTFAEEQGLLGDLPVEVAPVQLVRSR